MREKPFLPTSASDRPASDRPALRPSAGSPAPSPSARREVPRGIRSGPLLVVAAAVCWGTGGLAGSVLGDVSGLSPLAVGTYRLLVAAVVLLGAQVVLGRSPALLASARAASRHRSDAARLVGVGVGLAVFQVCYFVAVRAVGVSVATMLTLGLAPVLVTVGAAVLLRERPGRVLRLVLPVAVAGLVLLVGAGGGVVQGDGDTVLGVVAAGASATGYAGVTLLGRSLAARVPAEHVTTLGFVVAAVVALPAGLVAGMAATATAATVGLVVYLGLVPTALAYGLFFAGLRGTASGAASVLTLLEPLTATVLAVLLLGERLGPGQWAGATLLVVAVVVLSLAPARPRLPSAGAHDDDRPSR